MLAFGGRDQNGVEVDDTWELDSGAWARPAHVLRISFDEASGADPTLCRADPDLCPVSEPWGRYHSTTGSTIPTTA